MKRAAFFLLFHTVTAFLVVAATLGVVDLTDWQGPRALPIGLAALLLARPAHVLAEQAWERWFA